MAWQGVHKLKNLKLPDSVPVAGQVYSITVSPDLREAPALCWGYVRPDEKSIYLCDEFPDGLSLITTYFHEVLHAICSEYGVELNDLDVDRLAQGITQAFVALMEAQ